MSVKPSEEQGSEGRWFGEDFEKLDRFGSTVPRFDERGDEFQPENWEDESPEQKQCLYEPESNRQRPSVAMETASTGGNASLFDSLSSKGDSDLDLLMKSTDNDGDLYTSLLSSQNYSFQQDTSYFSGDMGGEAQKFPPRPGTASPARKPAGVGEDGGLQLHGHEPRRGGAARRRQPGPYLEKSPPVETLGPALDSHAFPYVEDPSDEEPSDYQSYRALGTPQTASPIKITLTETPAAPASEARPQVSERESILSLGLEGVPTVTLSEPEDDSPGSVTPPLEEDFPDPLFQAREVKLVGSASDRAFSSALPSSGSLRQPGPQGKAKRASKPRPSQEDGSSAESGDSEIELVSEEPSSAPLPPGAGYASFGPARPPPPRPSVQYSILREEREAELDSELIIESCDASSASEESPKREQDSPAPKGREPTPPGLLLHRRPAPPPAPPQSPPPSRPVVPPASAARRLRPATGARAPSARATPGRQAQAPGGGAPGGAGGAAPAGGGARLEDEASQRGEEGAGGRGRGSSLPTGLQQAERSDPAVS
ncbi:hypothetical protein ANANG_G00022490 [Anguilla anguilla]|uniref:Reticulon n=1 Tax=Anguilla anguilla TaxID=7936 RepID=A0A9D3MZL7_ANGAN|nr:hypothetical protein ANANG_G00022490 [Anguilla anguilla]